MLVLMERNLQPARGDLIEEEVGQVGRAVHNPAGQPSGSFVMWSAQRHRLLGYELVSSSRLCLVAALDAGYGTVMDDVRMLSIVVL